jgi:hypothetical protein
MMAPSTRTVYDYGQVEHDRVTRKWPEGSGDCVEVRLAQKHYPNDYVDVRLERNDAVSLAYAVLQALDVDVTIGMPE